MERGPYRNSKLYSITVEQLKEAFKIERSYGQVAVRLQISGGKYINDLLKSAASDYNLDLTHFLKYPEGSSIPQLPFEELKKDGSRRERLIKERGHRCEICKKKRWMNKKIPLELDHIDGHPDHNEKNNLRLICPNCHAQTEHYKGANVGHHKGTKRQEIMKRYPNYRSRE